jgi:hypothetical protein
MMVPKVVCENSECGPLMLFGDDVLLMYRVADSRAGAVVACGVRQDASEWIMDSGGAPRVYICCDEA